MTVSIGPTSLDLPAWFQAIGSVAAILVAIYLAERQNKLRERERREAYANIEVAELNKRAGFFNAVDDQLNSAFKTLDKIASEEQKYQSDPELRPKSSWNSWGESKLEEVLRDCVDRLERIANLPLEHWPDVQSALVFNDALKQWKDEIRELRQRDKIPSLVSDDIAREHWLGILNEVTYMSDWVPATFSQIKACAESAVSDANNLGLNFYVPGRNATADQLHRAAELILEAQIPSTSRRLGGLARIRDAIWRRPARTSESEYAA